MAAPTSDSHSPSVSLLYEAGRPQCWLLPTVSAAPTSHPCILIHSRRARLTDSGLAARVDCWTGLGLRHADLHTCALSRVLVSRPTRYLLGWLSRTDLVSDPLLQLASQNFLQRIV